MSPRKSPGRSPRRAAPQHRDRARLHPSRRPARGSTWRLSGVIDLGSFQRQLVLSTADLSALVAVGLVLSVQFVLSGSAVSSVNRLLDDRAATLVSAIDATTPRQRPVVPDEDVDPGIAVYDAGGELVAGFAPPRQSRFYDRLSTTPARRSSRLGDDYVILGRPFRTSSGATGVVVLSERLAPYLDDEHDALAVSIVAGSVLFLVATGLAAWASRRALAPVAQMARTAESWSEHELDRRFDLGAPTNELRALGATLDGLLEKVARAIVAEQRLTSELAHELRSPLAAVQGTAELVSMRDDLDDQLREDVTDIQQSCRRMANTVTSLLELARSQSSSRTGESCELGAVLRAVTDHLSRPEQVWTAITGEHWIAMPAKLAERAISPVVDNAVQHADHVTIQCSGDSRRVVVSIADDGPGVADEDAERIFHAGQTSGTGSGLGLALARRISRSVGGDVTLIAPDETTGHGATFHVRLPAATTP